jgi:hypothetical protein
MFTRMQPLSSISFETDSQLARLESNAVSYSGVFWNWKTDYEVASNCRENMLTEIMLKVYTTLSSCAQLSQYKSFANTLLEPFSLGGAVNTSAKGSLFG